MPNEPLATPILVALLSIVLAYMVERSGKQTLARVAEILKEVQDIQVQLQKLSTSDTEQSAELKAIQKDLNGLRTLVTDGESKSRSFRRYVKKELEELQKRVDRIEDHYEETALPISGRRQRDSADSAAHGAAGTAGFNQSDDSEDSSGIS